MLLLLTLLLSYFIFPQIECLNFPSMHMKQPFGVTFASNALLLVDFHAHLSSDEVVGYLGKDLERSGCKFVCRRRSLSRLSHMFSTN